MSDSVSRPSRIAVSGSTGLVGSALVDHLEGAGHEIRPIVRRDAAAGSGDISWDPDRGAIDREALEGLDGVVHLAGESIAAGRWTRKRKKSIRESRVGGTTLLCEALAGLEKPPAVLVSASAIGFYGDRGDEELSETSGRGDGFLPDVAAVWEQATDAAANVGIRVVQLRIGIVLSAKGGALAKMVTPFRLGLGGPLGSGRQYMSWIALSDLVRAIRFCLLTDTLGGPVNAVSPAPVTNAEFGKVLGGVLGRPAFIPAPSLALRLAMGEMAQELLLSSTRVVPVRLAEAGFEFTHPDLESALRAYLA